MGPVTYTYDTYLVIINSVLLLHTHQPLDLVTNHISCEEKYMQFELNNSKP